MFTLRPALLILIACAIPAIAADDNCAAEYTRGKREIGAYAEMMGVIEGTIYGHSLTIASSKICLVGSPKEKVQAIAKAFLSDSYARTPILMDDVPSKEQALEFLERFFPCK